MEKDERAGEQRETESVALYKGNRDAQAPDATYRGTPPATIDDATYTVVGIGGDKHITMRFSTSKNERKQDGSPNRWFGKQFVQYLNGPDNTTNFKTIGTFDKGELVLYPSERNNPAMIKPATGVSPARVRAKICGSSP